MIKHITTEDMKSVSLCFFFIKKQFSVIVSYIIIQVHYSVLSILQASGINIPQEVIDTHLALQSQHKFSTVIMRVNDKKTEVIVEDKFESQTYDELSALIKEKYALVPLYIVHDMKQNINGQNYARVIFIGW